MTHMFAGKKNLILTMKIGTHDMKLFHSIFAYNCVVKEQAYWEAIYKA